MDKQSQLVIYIARHGQAEFNVKRMIGGTYEPNPLTKKGQEQANTLAELFEHVKIDKIYSSDLSRAKETAQIVGSKHNLLVSVDPLIRERYWGRLQGKTFEEARIGNEEMYAKEKNIGGKEALLFKYVDDMESLGETIIRFKKFLKNLLTTEENKTILLISHFDVMMGYLIYLGYGTYQDLMGAELDHTGYYKLKYDGSKIHIVEVVGLHKKKSI